MVNIMITGVTYYCPIPKIYYRITEHLSIYLHKSAAYFWEQVIEAVNFKENMSVEKDLSNIRHRTK